LSLALSFASRAINKAVLTAKKIFYAGRGEPITLGGHHLRYVVGTRPIREKYVDSPVETVSNDVRQMMFLVQSVKPGDFVLDIGANVGQYAVLFAALAGPTGKVISFEPAPAARKVLAKNLSLNGFESRVTVEPMALSDSDGTHTFYFRGADSMASLEREGFGTEAGAHDIEETVVNTTTIDRYLSSRGLNPPDWIKLDAEGAEVRILRGAQSVLRSKTSIVCELHPYAWPAFDSRFDELLDLVRSAGRQIRYLDSRYDIESGARYAAVIIS
jgi:FkbM family methyltransferase